MIKVGDIVRTKKGSYDDKTGIRFTARVTQVEEGINTEDHGSIELCMIEATGYEIGELEHYCYFGWQQHFEIIDELE